MICVFIVEPHNPDRVARQFGMLQAIPSDPVYSAEKHKMSLKGNSMISWVQKHQLSILIWDSRLDHIFESALIVCDSTVREYQIPWYLQRTVRFISRLGAFYHYIGDMFRTIADRTHAILPDVSQLPAEGCNLVQDYNLYGFEALPLDERRDRERVARQDPGCRPTRGGVRAGRRVRGQAAVGGACSE